MRKPQISIRLFLALCLLIGTVGLPRGWKAYQAWLVRDKTRRDAEIKSAEGELRIWKAAYNDADAVIKALRPYGHSGRETQRMRRLQKRIRQLKQRLKDIRQGPRRRSHVTQ